MLIFQQIILSMEKQIATKVHLKFVETRAKKFYQT